MGPAVYGVTPLVAVHGRVMWYNAVYSGGAAGCYNAADEYMLEYKENDLIALQILTRHNSECVVPTATTKIRAPPTRSIATLYVTLLS